MKLYQVEGKTSIDSLNLTELVSKLTELPKGDEITITRIN